jgi:hypothetical protein
VLQDSNRLVLHLLPCNVVARIANVVDQPSAEFEVELAQRLAKTESPVAALEHRVDPRVYVRDGFVVTLWTYYEPVSPREVVLAEYAHALERLHAAMRQIDVRRMLPPRPGGRAHDQLDHGAAQIRYVVPTSSKGEEVPFCHLHSNYLCFVGMPRATGSPFAFSPPFVRHKWSEAAFPISGRFVRELKAAFQEHFGEVTKAQSVTNAPQDDQQHDVGGKFKIVEGRARPLIEGPMAVMAAKHAIAELGLPREMGRRGRRAMRTWHLRLLNM